MATAKYKRDKNGYFHTMAWDGTYTETGQKHRIHLRTRQSSAALEKMVADLARRVEDGKVVRKTDLSFADYAAQWAQVKNVYTRNTQRQYDDIIKYYIRPALSSVPVSSVSKYHLQKLILDNAEHPRTCQLIRRVFLQVVTAAIDDKYLAESVLRPLQGVEMPRTIKRERRTLTTAEKKAVMTADFTPMQRAFVYLLFYCGLRRGEALGITVSDCDLSALTLSVCRSVELVNNESAVKIPKSANGFRSIPIAPPFADFLREYLPTVPGGYLVHNRAGGIMTQSAFRRMWEQIIKKMQAASPEPITGLTPHIFRHDLCTELCYQVPSISTKKIARIMGHDESMVMRVYSHILEQKEDAPGAFSKVFASV